MSDVVLKINDAVSLQRVLTILAPYIKDAVVKEPPRKIWDGKADWLVNPIKVDSFTPLSREEIYDRQALRHPNDLHSSPCEPPPYVSLFGKKCRYLKHERPQNTYCPGAGGPVLCFNPVCPEAGRKKTTLGNAEADYEVDTLLRELSSAGAPLVRKGYLIFTAALKARSVAIVFDFEDFAVIHPLTRRDMTDENEKVVSSFYYYVTKMPEQASAVAYKLIVDSLWILDPHNPDRVYNPAVGTLSQVRLPRSPAVTSASRTGPVRFVYRGEEGQAITVSGTFSNWDPYIYEMIEVSPGYYEAWIPLPPGTYLYNFVRGLREFSDPENHDRSLTPDGRSAARLQVRG